MGEKKSPITGKSFQALSKDYKKFKRDFGSTPTANLELTGDMLDSLTYRITKDGIELGVYGDDAPKADGHNNLSGKSQLPERQFLPKEGETFKGSIQKEIESIIAVAVAEQSKPPRQKLKSVSSRADLFSVLKDTFGDLTKSQYQTVVTESPEWRSTLTEFGLLKWLV